MAAVDTLSSQRSAGLRLSQVPFNQLSSRPTLVPPIHYLVSLISRRGQSSRTFGSSVLSLITMISGNRCRSKGIRGSRGNAGTPVWAKRLSSLPCKASPSHYFQAPTDYFLGFQPRERRNVLSSSVRGALSSISGRRSQVLRSACLRLSLSTDS